MARLSISKAWNETTAFLGREARLILPIALLLLALPAIASALLDPLARDQTPDGMQLALSLLLTFATLVIGLVGTVAISHLALRPGSSVGEALQVGVRRFLPLFLSSLLIGLAAALLAFLVVLLFAGGLPSSAIMTGEEVSPMLALAFLIIFFAALALWVRFMLMAPVATAEQGGPIAIIARSWSLTSGHFWRLLGTVLLLLLVALVVFLAVSSVFAILITVISGGPPAVGGGGWAITLIVAALFQTLFSVILMVLVARIYAQVSGAVAPDVFA